MVVSVMDYGAAGDGVTDDKVAIQTAFNSGNKLISMPDKHFKVSGTLTLPAGVFIEGYGKEATIIETYQTSGWGICSTYSNPADGVNYSGAGGAAGFTIRRKGGTLTDSVGLHLVNHRESVFEDIIVDNFNNSVLLAGFSLNNRFTGVKGLTAMGDSWIIYHNPRHNVFIDCYGNTCGVNTACYSIESGSGAPINDLSFFGCSAEAGNYTDPVGNVSHTASGNKGWKMFGDTTDKVTGINIVAPRIDFAVGGTSYGFSQETGSQNVAVRDPFYSGCTNLSQSTSSTVFSITHF